jgi:cytochrome b6-f complex iron-sulfur subunit
MNLLLLGAIGLPGLPLAGGFAYFFVPPSCAPAQRAGVFRASASGGGLRGSAHLRLRTGHARHAAATAR